MQQKRYHLHFSFVIKKTKRDFTNYIASKFLFFTDGFYKPMKQIQGAHKKAETNSASKPKKKRLSTRGMGPSVVSFLSKALLKRMQPCAAEILTIQCFAGHAAECNCGFISRSAHAHLLRSS